MKQKGLTLRDIEIRSEGKITDGYVADILRGAASNPSAEKIKALARGLGVDPHALFDVVCGPFERRAGEPPREETPYEDTSNVVAFLETMQEVAESPELTKVLEETIQLAPEERAIVLRTLESLNERARKPRRAKKSPPDRK
jgi:transcriptional regulator with XRE-family HTH domain